MKILHILIDEFSDHASVHEAINEQPDLAGKRIAIERSKADAQRALNEGAYRVFWYKSYISIGRPVYILYETLYD